jgi:hypothetical protein
MLTHQLVKGSSGTKTCSRTAGVLLGIDFRTALHLEAVVGKVNNTLFELVPVLQAPLVQAMPALPAKLPMVSPEFLMGSPGVPVEAVVPVQMHLGLSA